MSAAVEQQINNLSLKEKVDHSPSPPNQPVDPPPKEKTDETPKEKEEEQKEKKEVDDEPAVIKRILPDEDFTCCLGENCLLKDPKLKEDNEGKF